MAGLFPLSWMSLNLTGDKSTLVQVMAWCRQATSHYLKHCWHRSMSPYGVTRPQYVKCCTSNADKTNSYMHIKYAVKNVAAKVQMPWTNRQNSKSKQIPSNYTVWAKLHGWHFADILALMAWKHQQPQQTSILTTPIKSLKLAWHKIMQLSWCFVSNMKMQPNACIKSVTQSWQIHFRNVDF